MLSREASHLKYTPIKSEEEVAKRIDGLGYNRFTIYTYADARQRKQGEPSSESADGVSEAVSRFMEACKMFPCVELHGVDLEGSEEALCIGGTDQDLREEGEFIEWPELE